MKDFDYTKCLWPVDGVYLDLLFPLPIVAYITFYIHLPFLSIYLSPLIICVNKHLAMIQIVSFIIKQFFFFVFFFEGVIDWWMRPEQQTHLRPLGKTNSWSIERYNLNYKCVDVITLLETILTADRPVNFWTRGRDLLPHGVCLQNFEILICQGNSLNLSTMTVQIIIFSL